ncbi:hypothetical protein R1flu_018566 [Riccia fluitans]|uniref:Uncharacterized protein n=1 Tax=Riccia fluitans TaxID=41844 RepID=A0ABD1ZG70_9MARC
MPTCRYHPSEPADRVCAPCLASKLNSLTRREGGGIRRLVADPLPGVGGSGAGYYGSSAYYPDEDDLPYFSLHGIGFELEKKPGGAITTTAAVAASTMLLRSDSHRESSHRESASSANAFFSCGSEMSNRLSADTHSEVDVKSTQAATPSRKSDSRRYNNNIRMEQSGTASNTATVNDPCYPPAVSFNPPPYGVQSSVSSHFPVSDVDILHLNHQHNHHVHHPAAAASVAVSQNYRPQSQAQRHQFSERLCISDMISKGIRETDIKYRKQPGGSSSFGHNLAKRNAELSCDPNHRTGICLKTPVWKFKLFSKSSSFWRLGLKGSNKVSPSKRDVDVETRGGASHKDVSASTSSVTNAAATSAGGPVLRHSSNTRRLVVASQPDDSVRLWCPSPMVSFKEGSFRWGKGSDKGSASGRRTDGLELEVIQTEDEQHQQQQQQGSSSGVFQRLYEFTHRRRNSGNRSETESNSSWNNDASRAQEIPPRTLYDEEQAQLAANILSWMDGAASVAELQQQEDLLPASCSTMAAKTGEISRFPEPELSVS